MKDVKDKIQKEIESIKNTPTSKSKEAVLKFLSIVFKSLDKGVIRSKRSVFYDCVSVFKTQTRVDSLIKKYTCKFQCKMEDLNIRASPKGLFYGDLTFEFFNGQRIEYHGKNLIPEIVDVKSVILKTKIILIIEKDTVFENVCCESLVVICGKGYPCTNTISLLKMLEPHVKMYCLTDLDPYGLHIYTNYKKHIPSVQRIGLSSEDVFKYKLDTSQSIPLSKYDYKMIEKLRNFDVLPELMFIEGIEAKIELEMVLNKDEFDIFEYLEKLENT